MAFDERTLLQWMHEPGTARGLHFAGPADTWQDWSHAALAGLAWRVVAALGEHGVGRDHVVVNVQRSSPGFTATLFGTIAAGATACSVAPPFAFQRTDDYLQHAGHLISTAGPALVVCDAESLDVVRTVCAAVGAPRPVLFDDLVRGAPMTVTAAAPPDVALLQFTSGSSGAARGVPVRYEALQANVTAMRRWLDWGPESPGLTWLPVHHDLGLIGCLVNIMVTGCLMQPDDFIRDPLRYLRCLSDQRIELTAMPNFGLAYLLRRVQPEQLEGLSFEVLHAMILGAERIDARVLDATLALLGPYGLSRKAFLPAYGGAEATLAATCLRPGEGWTAAVPDEGSAAVVGCGRPLPGVDVRIVDDAGEPVADGQVGEIVVRGPSVAAGYHGPTGSASGTRLGQGRLNSGDAGFLRDGQLFVLGRMGDGLKVRARMVFAESLELALVQRGIPPRRATVLLGVRDGTPTAVVVVDGDDARWPVIAGAVLREAMVDVDLLWTSVPRGALAVTSSGKPRRRVMWQALCAGAFPGPLLPLPDAAAPAQRAAEPMALVR